MTPEDILAINYQSPKRLKRKKQGGWALTDNIAGVMITLAMLTAVAMAIPEGLHMYDMFKVKGAVNDFNKASVNWKGVRSNYAGIDEGDLCTDNYLNPTVCGPANDAASTNPWGGNYTVTANANSSHIDVAITGIEATRVNQVADSLASITYQQCAQSDGCATIDVSGTTVTLTL